ncbi:MAG TPA: type II toxin-antitoxin system VapC family toxin [Acetobacteraceae bacterium]|jgi:hypothetical protein
MNLGLRRRPQPNRGVVRFLEDQDEDTLFLSVVTFAELRRGVERLPEGQRRRRSDAWLRDDLTARFAGRVLGIDDSVADAWGRIVASAQQTGRQISATDAWIAAIARTSGLTLVSRNVADFAGTLDDVVNPWTA